MLCYAVKSKVGGRRINEDSVGVAEINNRQCFVVCDGLGGHGMGDVASQTVKNVFCNQFTKFDNNEDFLAQTFLAAQDILLSEQIANRAKQKMKTTAVVLAADEKNAHIGYIGDSRLYVFNKNKVKTRTLDHSIPQMMVLSGEIKENEIRNHPDRNIVLRVMGVEWEDPMFELMKPIPLKKCQAFLLCTDGFWELVEEKEMCDLLKKSETVIEWLDGMEQIVLKNGKGREMDNYSAIAIWNIKK